ncbi:MAG: hypothetical protein IJA83_10995 [Clostridia bacterium]|nr:hypothetical protein [Clostridia bacterium]
MKRLILPLLAAVMIWVMAATWGSIGSAVMAFGLISMGSALLYQRFLNRDDPDFYE